MRSFGLAGFGWGRNNISLEGHCSRDSLQEARRLRQPSLLPIITPQTSTGSAEIIPAAFDETCFFVHSLCDPGAQCTSHAYALIRHMFAERPMYISLQCAAGWIGFHISRDPAWILLQSGLDHVDPPSPSSSPKGEYLHAPKACSAARGLCDTFACTPWGMSRQRGHIQARPGREAQRPPLRRLDF